MAANQVTLTFAGDSSKLEKAFDDVGGAADRMGKEVGEASKEIGRSGEAFDRQAERADVAEQRAMGFRDTITGVQDTTAGFSQIMKGDLAGGFLTLGMGIGDLSSGIANLLVPLAKTVSGWVAGHATMAISAVTSAAAQVGAWIALGVQSLISAGQVALAWLISIGPIILVGAAVVGLAYLIYRNWDTIKRITVEVFSAVSSFVQNSISSVINFVKSIPGAVTSALGGLADVFLAPWRAAFGGIRTLWNSTIGGKGFEIPSWVPGIGGKGFTIPRLASGGIVTSPTIAMIGEAGPEAVVPLPPGSSGPAGSGRTVIEFRSSGARMDDLIMEVVRRSVKARGGVEVAFA